MAETAALAVGREDAQDVFQALYQHWRGVKNPARKHRLSKILLAAKAQRDEIDFIRERRRVARLFLEQKANIDGNFLTGELHLLEHEACKILCPALAHGTGTAQKEGWLWILKQPWGKDFRAAPFEKRYHG